MKKILIINDDLDTMFLLKRWLGKKGFDVRYGININDVYKIVDKFAPDVLMVDFFETEVAAGLRSYLVDHRFKLLLMTGHELRFAKNNLPADDTIEKPFNLDALEKKLRKLTTETG